MGKAMTIGGLVVALLVALLFLLDLALGVPFQRASWIIDVCFLISGLGMATLSFLTLREIK